MPSAIFPRVLKLDFIVLDRNPLRLKMLQYCNTLTLFQIAPEVAPDVGGPAQIVRRPLAARAGEG